MDKNAKIVIIGAGMFGLSTAYQLASEGYRDILVLDRHTPPVPDGSSVDISRVVRFDYADDTYMDMALEAYKKWHDSPRYKGIFFPAHYFLAVGQPSNNVQGGRWTDKTTSQLTKRGLPWTPLDSVSSARQRFPILSGKLAGPVFSGYCHEQAGWADAAKAITQLRDDCVELGVSFLCGNAGTVVGFDSTNGVIKGAKTAAGTLVRGDRFILTAGSWAAGLVPFYNSVISTAQVLGYIKLSDAEMEKYKNVPIYTNCLTGWFNFPPHEDTRTFKMAVHGWGYTRTPNKDESARIKGLTSSTPPLRAKHGRPDFVPKDGEERLREGLREILPELADRPFDQLALCWYTDSPTGDFVMDYHPDYKNLFIGGSGSGHGFKFLPVLGEYMAKAFHKKLPSKLAHQWRFRTDFKNAQDAFEGDGSRGGPARRELSSVERARYDGHELSKM